MSETFQLFNLATMSGVFPGTRTMVYQRVRLAALAQENAVATMRWARLLWYTAPPACVVELEANPATGAAAEPLVRILAPPPATLGAVLAEALAAAGWRLVTCGGCAHWQLHAAQTPDELPTGLCTWRRDVESFPDALTAQSLLALSCDHWQAADAPAPTLALAPPGALDTVAPIRKRAEQENDERWTLAGQVRRWLRRPAPTTAAPASTWAERVIERSGVGAGAEPCFACQGRIANLGALVVATPEGDKQTFSIWRCRNCYTYYLNDWIDRWERTDNLETEERYYRLSPAEALEVLAVIDNVVHAEHPARRHERDAQRRWMLEFLKERVLLSHQIRQGR